MRVRRLVRAVSGGLPAPREVSDRGHLVASAASSMTLAVSLGWEM